MNVRNKATNYVHKYHMPQSKIIRIVNLQLACYKIKDYDIADNRQLHLYTSLYFD